MGGWGGGEMSPILTPFIQILPGMSKAVSVILLLLITLQDGEVSVNLSQ